MTTHRMNLQPVYIAKIKAGEKAIELRLYDEKRQAMNLGDHIVFWHESMETEVTVTITALLRYPGFAQLVEDLPLAWFGWESKAKALADIARHYTPQQQAENGVVGIRFQRT